MILRLKIHIQGVIYLCMIGRMNRGKVYITTILSEDYLINNDNDNYSDNDNYNYNDS